MAFSPEEIDLIVEGVRAGARVTIGGSRANQSYYGRDGSFWCEDFDEGHTSEQSMNETELRSLIDGHPESFTEVLRSPLRADFAAALLAQAPDASQRLARLRAYGDAIHHSDAIAAWLDGERPVLDGNSAYHAIMSSLRYPTPSPEVGAAALRFFAALDEEQPQVRRYRAGFRLMVGDFDGAVADLEWEVAHGEKGLERELSGAKNAAFIAKMRAAPDDDTPRLIWADALLERGDERGHLVSEQCKLARLDEDDPERFVLDLRTKQRVAKMLREEDRWLNRVDVRFARGIPDSISIRWSLFSQSAGDIFALDPPIREIRFVIRDRGDSMDRPEDILDDPRLERVPAIDFGDPCFFFADETEQPFGPALVAKLEGRLPSLRSLEIRRVQFSSRELASVCARKLTTLDLRDCRFQAGLEHALPPDLRELRLRTCGVNDEDMHNIARLEHLESLDVSGNRELKWPALAKLHVRKLGLSLCEVDDSALPFLRKNERLRSLDLGYAKLSEGGVASLGDFKELRRLRLGGLDRPKLRDLPNLWQLDLEECQLETADVVALLDALPALRSLRLRKNRINDLAPIVKHPQFAQIEELDVGWNNLGPMAGVAFRNGTHVPMRLSLAGSRLGFDGVHALLNATEDRRLVELDLVDAHIGAESVQALTESGLILSSLWVGPMDFEQKHALKTCFGETRVHISTAEKPADVISSE